MAAADDANDPAQPAPPAKKRGWMIALLALVVLGAAGGGGAWYLLEPEAPVEDAPPEVHYLALEPELVVNFRDGGRLRYLQAGLELMAHEPAVLEAAETHMPALRHELLVMLSEQDFRTLASGEGKAQLRAAALERVRATLEARGDAYAVEDVFFTSFVMQ